MERRGPILFTPLEHRSITTAPAMICLAFCAFDHGCFFALLCFPLSVQPTNSCACEAQKNMHANNYKQSQTRSLCVETPLKT